jgi:acyl carrier protein
MKEFKYKIADNIESKMNSLNELITYLYQYN